ncbi:MAG: hypothetical protein NDJ65_09265 [Paludibacteraceae bacterium]|nr:hypothetical protein [Paludibacteraceae bacterium]
MISGITPAQAAKEIYGQRGEAMMMAGQRGRKLTNTSLTEEEKDSIREYINSLSEKEMERGSGTMIRNGYLYAFNFAPKKKHHKDNLRDGEGFEVWSKTYVQDLIDSYEQNGGASYERLVQHLNSIGLLDDNQRRYSRVENDTELSRDDRNDSGISPHETEIPDRAENLEHGKNDNGEGADRTTTIKTGWNGSNHPRYLTTTKEELRKLQDGLDSGVQLMEGSDGTVYGWCEIERDAEGNVVARHIYLNDEVLARMIDDRVVRKKENGTPFGVPFPFFKVITNHFFNPKAGE